MHYISGLYALNIPCKLRTFGDWHYYSLNWDDIPLWNSGESPWGEYGIETNRFIGGYDKPFNVANHIRAVLDLIRTGQFTLLQGMRRELISNDSYNKEIFEKVVMLKEQENWISIHQFMCGEYKFIWNKFLHPEMKSLLTGKLYGKKMSNER